MSLAFSYNYRHLLVRKTTTLMTILGIALVVFVFTATLMMAHGLELTLAATGSPDNVIAIRSGAQNEIQSGVSRESVNIILAEPEVARRQDNSPLATAENLALVALRKRSDNQLSNVNLRGVSRSAFEVRPEVRVIAGRLPEPGTAEVIVGSAINRKFGNTDIGSKVRLAGVDWPVVGIFDAGTSGFNSEIWGDVDVLMPAFRREQFTSVTMRLAPGTSFEDFRKRIENDKRLSVWLKRENEFYADQSEALATFIRILGTFVSVFFSVGAVIGAMITMYSAVSNRVREIGILRALGFKASTVFSSFLKECLLISFAGGVVGIALASCLSLVFVSTANFMTFSEVAFGFALNTGIVLKSLIFALSMGLIGGALPAFKAARLKLMEALRA